jgi:hypothetical protein
MSVDIESAGVAEPGDDGLIRPSDVRCSLRKCGAAPQSMATATPAAAASCGSDGNGSGSVLSNAESAEMPITRRLHAAPCDEVRRGDSGESGRRWCRARRRP